MLEKQNYGSPYGDLPVLTEGKQVWFPILPWANILGYNFSHDPIFKELKPVKCDLKDTVTISLSRSDVYKLIINSSKDKIEVFEDWFSGMFVDGLVMTVPYPPSTAYNPLHMREVTLDSNLLKQIDLQNKKLEIQKNQIERLQIQLSDQAETIKKQAIQLRRNKWKIKFYDRWMKIDDVFTATMVGKFVHRSPRWVHNWAEEKGFIWRNSQFWYARQEFEEKYFTYIIAGFTTKSNYAFCREILCWTKAGLIWTLKEFQKDGIDVFDPITDVKLPDNWESIMLHGELQMKYSDYQETL